MRVSKSEGQWPVLHAREAPAALAGTVAKGALDAYNGCPMHRKSPLGPGYVHPRSRRVGNHTCGLDIADELLPNYHRWITQLCRPFVGDHALEIGAGYGAVTTFLAKGVADYVATDTSPECLAALESRFREMPNVSVRKLDILGDQPEGAFNSIIMINVLEHLHHDSEVLNALSEHLAPDGKLIIYVPALNCLYGDWDDAIGHYRRYSKRQLEHVLLAAGTHDRREPLR